MTVSYAPPLGRSSAFGAERCAEEALSEGPAYVRTRRMGRWHRVRSSTLQLHESDPKTLRQSWTTWCGQGVPYGRDPWLTDAPPTDEPRCGTCEGRYAGWVAEHGWIFTPATLDPPKTCPGSQTMLVQELAYNRGICAVCLKPVKLRGYGSWHNGRYGAQRHAPGLDLIPGCPFHAWRELTIHDGAVVCTCTVAHRQTTGGAG